MSLPSKSTIFDGLSERELIKRRKARKTYNEIRQEGIDERQNGHGGARIGAGRPKGSKEKSGVVKPDMIDRRRIEARSRNFKNIMYVGEDIWEATITHGSLEIMPYLGVTTIHLYLYLEHGLPHYLPELRQGDHNANYDPAGISQRGFVKREVDEWCLANPNVLVCPPLEWKITTANRDDYDILEGKALVIYPIWAL